MTQGRRIKDVVLERYLAGALDDAARRAIEDALDKSEPDKRRLAELRADTEAFLVRHPPGPFVAKWEAVRKRKRFAWMLPAVLLPVAAAAAALLYARREPEFAVKGEVVLVLHKRQGDSTVRVEPGAALSPGDSIRFEVRSPLKGYVAVVGRDASGAVTAYHPFGALAAAPYDPASPVLPGGIQLDLTRGRETVWALFSTDPIDLGPILEALRAGRPIGGALPRGVAWASFEFDKR